MFAELESGPSWLGCDGARRLRRRVNAIEPKHDDSFDVATAAANAWLTDPTKTLPTEPLCVEILLDKLRSMIDSGNESLRPLLYRIEQQRFTIIMGWL